MPASTLEWYLKYIASLPERPMSAIRLVTTTVDSDSCVISGNGRSFTLLTRLQQEAHGNILLQVVLDDGLMLSTLFFSECLQRFLFLNDALRPSIIVGQFCLKRHGVVEVDIDELCASETLRKTAITLRVHRDDCTKVRLVRC